MVINPFLKDLTIFSSLFVSLCVNEQICFNNIPFTTVLKKKKKKKLQDMNKN